ncbi:FtsK/SpoIIIE domain-containing protein [Stutzerimonas decontaminans]|uniref:Cell division protein FtsK n=1 Tax=Stutzerimonas stutzeri TaxID=316 RepID=A0A023WSZ8_STUST|nr:FtsK/SpoIIIE domain-containing protein [Stutzerimonas decontaminans]AHY42825.1 cell division protein FtsK [Stutzerimonas decontaminans]
MKGSLEHPDQIVCRIIQAIADYQEGLARIDREFDAAATRREQTLQGLRKPGQTHLAAPAQEAVRRLADEERKTNASRGQRTTAWRSAFVQRWEGIATNEKRSSGRLRREQPALADLVPTTPWAVADMPACLFLGSRQLGFEDLTCSTPNSIPFPLTSALAFLQSHTGHKQWVTGLLLRLLSALPPTQLELTFIDPLRLGQSVEPFLPLLKVEQLVPAQRVLTRADEIESALGRLTDDVEELLQHRFNDESSNWSAYNAKNPDCRLAYKALVLFDAPEQLSEKSLWFLQRLCENGPRCGVLPIIAIDERRLTDQRYEKFRATAAQAVAAFDALFTPSSDTRTGLSLTCKPEQWPSQERLGPYLLALAEECARKARFSRSLEDLWAGFHKGATTCAGFDIPIGWTAAGAPASFILGATTSEHHALLAGKTGSGKSNLLHVLIHSLCQRYSPAEVDLYLLDYKESTEFNIYADPPLPHARLVATESDPEYGVTVLRHLVGEMQRRARLFKDHKVSDFAGFRARTGERLPRSLLVIDEFQVLFAGTRPVAEAAEQLLSQLLKQGRSFGIHVLLATQTLKGINAMSLGSITTQLGCRIALACGQEDSAMILGANNWAASELQSPPEGIINNANGARSGNIKFLIPLADSDACRKHISKLAEHAALLRMEDKTRIFNGASLPEPPSASTYQNVCAREGALLLGQQLTFDADMLTVPLIQRPAFNILFSGYNDAIHDGLLNATLSSLAASNRFDEIIYFNARGVTANGGFTSATRASGSPVQVFDDLAALPLQAVADAIGSRRVALIIDGLDSEKLLHPPTAFRAPKPGEPPSPGDLLKRIAEDGPRQGVFVLAFVERWQRCASACKDLLSCFELRLAYCMTEDDAGSLVSTGIGKFKGLEKPNRAVLVNRMTGETTWFRPYVARSSL